MPSSLGLDALVRDLLGADGASAPDEVAAAWNGPDSPWLRSVAEDHRLEAVVSDALRRAGAPPDPELEAVILDDRRVRLLASRALADIGTALDDADAPWLVFKGPAISHLMPRPELRTFNDIDLLVGPSSFPDAVDALIDAGADELNQNWGPYLRHRVGEVPMAMHGVTIDVHWHVTGLERDRSAFRFDPEAMLDRRVSGEIDGRPVPLFDPVDQLIHLSVHAALGGGTRLDQLRDVAVVAEGAEVEWGTLVERSRQAWVEGLVAHVLDRAQRIAGAAIPDGVASELAGESSLRRRRRLDGDRVTDLRAVPLVWWRRRRTDLVRAALRRTGERAAGSWHRGWDFTEPRSRLYHARPSGGTDGRRRFLDAVAHQRW